jgi:hypothetical protein
MKWELHPNPNNINVIFAMPKSEIVELEENLQFCIRECNAKGYFLYNTVPCIT